MDSRRSLLPTRHSRRFDKAKWAAQFGASPSFGSLGFLRFTSPTGAWLLDVRFNLTEADEESSVTVDTVTQTRESRLSSGGFSARIGRRNYLTLADKAASFLALGAIGGYGRTTEFDDFNRRRSSNWNIGVFADLGGDYFPTERLSIGGSFGLQAQYTRIDVDPDSASGNIRIGIRTGTTCS